MWIFRKLPSILCNSDKLYRKQLNKKKHSLPDLLFWRSSWSCHHTRSHTTATPEVETLWAPGGSCCLEDPGKKSNHIKKKTSEKKGKLLLGRLNHHVQTSIRSSICFPCVLSQLAVFMFSFSCVVIKLQSQTTVCPVAVLKDIRAWNVKAAEQCRNHKTSDALSWNQKQSRTWRVNTSGDKEQTHANARLL